MTVNVPVPTEAEKIRKALAGQVSARSIAAALAPVVSRGARAAAPEIRARCGRLAWAAAWPAWRVLTMPTVLAILLRVALEIAVAALTVPHAGLIWAVIGFIRALLRPGPPAPAGSVASTPVAYGGLLDVLAEYRDDPLTIPALESWGRFLTATPTQAAMSALAEPRRDESDGVDPTILGGADL